MTKQDKYDLVDMVVRDYIDVKKKSIEWQMKDAGISFKAGRMVGVLMAFGLELEETQNQIKVYYPEKKRLFYVASK